MGKIIDITGQKYNRLTVLSYVGLKLSGRKGGVRSVWLCRCDCGQEIHATSNALRRNNTKSCGCFAEEVRKTANKTHGYSRTLIYTTWANMISRCECDNRPDFEHYGGRGIRVCDRWRDSFEAFREDMGNRPFKGASLDRIDVNGNYEPGNVKWATQREQTRNKRNNHLLEIDGSTKTIAEWAEVSGVDQKLILHRIVKGWTVRDAVYLPKQNRWSGRKK